MSEREVDKTPPHDCGFHRGEGASCTFHEKWNQRGVAHPDGGAPPCEECGAAITGGALECPKCGYIQQGGAPPEPSEEAIAVARAILAKGRHPNWVPKALRAAYAVDFVRAASRPGHP
jgi:hypothetical protein